MLELVGVAIPAAAGILGYVNSRQFVRTKLRFVDAVQRRRAPWIAGVAAALVAAPVAWALPLIGGGTALLFGASVGAGVAHGARDIRRGSVGMLEP
jgi:hypothetical protein